MKGEIKALTSLRGIAAMAVVLQHFSATAQSLTPQWIPSIVPHGYMAVHFFFVLSGFIMCLTYLPSFQQRGVRAFPEFMLKRIGRIMPLNTFTLIGLMALGTISRLLIDKNIFFGDTSLIVDLPANFLMLQGIGIGHNLNGPSWSISTEFAAYMLFPIFIFLVFGLRRVGMAVTLSVALFALCAVAYNSPHLGLGSMVTAHRLIETFAEFVLGMVAFAAYKHRLDRGHEASDLEFGGLLIAASAAMIARIDLPVALLCPFIVVAAALNRGYFARILSGGFFYFLGVISFSIYLIHDPFRPVSVLIFHAMHPQPTSAVTALVFALIGSFVVIPFAWLTYRAIERPGRDVIRRWTEIFARRDQSVARVTSPDRVL